MDVEAKDPNSSLALYKKSLSLRRSHPALGGEGAISWIEAPKGVMHFTREPQLEVVVNTLDDAIVIKVSGTLILLESESGSELQDGVLTLAANTTIWLQK